MSIDNVKKDNMNKNDSYRYIINYIKMNKSKLEKEELKFLLNYAAILKEKDIENITNIDVKILVKDLAKLNENIKSGDLTTLSFERLERELKLFDEILESGDLENISYELDKLYMENDMGVRQHSALVKKLYTEISKGVSK